ncbi:hypothetical protein GSI_11892 [Ganoderma sinense ZZ0214-1]|uniref:F-box domain-containing protein n=1 Tax=Ganoderma sinense ZZ0214-1 TaxID=1077348 RepID=A0A2G8RXC1_9APHY|nr:hypothetical protein GSI_11892 [Ganoderma sinense ZZ0214-1]
MADVQASAPTLVLTNSDLLSWILTFVAAPRMRGSRSKSHDPSRLAPCATVCRAFHEIAIRLLWRSLPSLIPLWHLFAPPNTKRPPSSTLQGDKRPDYLRKVVSARLYDDPQVWERFLCYTTRVRHIAHSTYSSDSPETTVLQLYLIQVIVLKNGGNPVLPLLHSILWAAKAPTDNSLVALFAPTLRSATLSLQSVPGDEETRALLFRRLHESSPHLENIELGSGYNSDKDLAVGPLLVQELLLFDRLRQLTVHCGLSGPATFLAFVAKPNLTSLSVRNVSGPSNAPHSPPTVVRDLVELSIEGTGPTLVGLFELVRFEALESATIRIENSPDVRQETEDVLTAFHNTLTSPSTLRGFTLCIYGWGSKAEGPAISLRDLVRPVLPLQEICSFKFSSHSIRPQIEVADIAALTGAWPNLERLVLDAHPPSSSDAFSLDALHYIHAHCPQLRDLDTHSICLPVLGVHAIPAPLERPSSSAHALRRLWASGVYVYRPEYKPGRIVAEHAEALARYLLELFPALDMEEYKPWVPRPGVRQTSAPGHCLDGRKVLARMYTLTSERERELQ